MAIVSIETPVFKGGWLQRCIDSVLHQSSDDWRLSLLWDGGDKQSRRILEDLDRRNHPNVTVYFGENRGISRARRFLTEHSDADFVLPLDDDDALPFYAVERFLSAAERLPWSSVIRARRKIIGADGEVIDTPPWFPFEPRHYQHGMVTDPFNHSQPYLIRRSAYERTTGWEGFEDFRFAGEDCDIFLKLEEVGTIELLDEALYYYRVHSDRASLELTDEAAFEMWRRLADKTIARIGLPLRRVNDFQPFHYERTSRPEATMDAVDFVVVTGEGTMEPLTSSPAARSLRHAGVSDSALHLVARGGARQRNERFRQTTRPFVCFVDSSVDFDAVDRFETLLRLVTEKGCDLAAPKLLAKDGSLVFANPGLDTGGVTAAAAKAGGEEGRVDGPHAAPRPCAKLILVRREVLRAVGGFDDGYERDDAAMVDFCLRARQREFTCAYLGDVVFTCRESSRSNTADGEDEGAGDWRRLRRKWARYPELLTGAIPAPETVEVEAALTASASRPRTNRR